MTQPNLWTFSSRVSGHTRTVALELHPELNLSPVVGEDHLYDLPGKEQFRHYVEYVQEEIPEDWAKDSIGIYWGVSGKGTFESAPFQHHYPGKYPIDEDFLTHFTWPTNAKTGEMLDWFSLPVVNDRFPKWAKALNWTPSPLQPTCPLQSIVASRNGQVIKKTF